MILKEDSNRILTEEQNRVKALNNLMLDFHELGNQIQPIVKLVARLTGAKWVLLNILDQSNQWTISSSDRFFYGMPKEKTVCQYTIKSDSPLEIKNLKEDDRFKGNSLIMNNKHIKFYYGIPFSVDGKNNIGSLCMLSPNQIAIDSILKETLELAVDQVVEIFRLHSEKNRLRQKMKENRRQFDLSVHDIRNHIAVIHGSSELLAEQCRPNTVLDGIDLTETIQKSSKAVMDYMLNYKSIIREGIQFKLVILEDLKEKLLRYYSDQAEISGVNLNIGVEKNETRIYVKVPQFMQLIGNFITNAIKFTPENKNIHVFLRLEKAESKGGIDDYLLLVQIQDEGIGIPPDDVLAIQSFNSPKSRKGLRGEASNGTGMQVVFDSLEKMQARLHVESFPGEGTLFEVAIPCSSKAD